MTCERRRRGLTEEGEDDTLGMTGSLEEKAWIFWRKGHAQATKEPVLVQPKR